MKQLLAILTFLALACNDSTYAQRKNLLLHVKVDSVLSSCPQWIYLYYYNHNDLLIEDSAFISPASDEAVLTAYIPEQTGMQLTFSKKGPNHVLLVGTPQDTINLCVNEEDGIGMVWKEVEGSPATNENSKVMNMGKRNSLLLLNWQSSIFSITDKDSVELQKLQDSIDMLNQKEVDMRLYIIKHSKHPRNVWSALLSPEVTRALRRDSVIRLWQEARLRFPNHQNLQTLYDTTYVTPPETAKSKHDTPRIMSILKEKFMAIRMENQKKESISFSEDMEPAKIPPLRGNYALTDFVLQNDKGEAVSLKQLQSSSKYLLLDFWASWCIPCMKNMGLLKRIQKEYGNKIRICLISLNKEESYWKNAIRLHGLNSFDNLIATKDGVLDAAIERLEIKQIPFNYLLDPGGNIIAINLFEEELASKIKELFN